MKKNAFIFILIFLTGCTATITSNVIKEYGPEPAVFFCPRDNCELQLINLIDSAKERVHCAFYDLDLENLINSLNNSAADVRLVLDDRNFINLSSKKDWSYGLMHNKFCVIDNIVWTGSMNPTLRGNSVNNNNVIVFYSANIAKIFEKEFDELWNKEFRKGDFDRKEVFINNKKIEILFCPDDWCASRVINLLSGSEKSIYFMTFSFTHEKIADMLISKKNKGLIVKGVMEKSQNSKYSRYDELLNAGVDVKWDSNSANMHHKVFIIDESIVITGSFNPTISGDTRNDENLVVIHSEDIAKNYINEFNLLYS
jgi:phosphatidylserine/phosphatidylglycerophosphate/cardiolipin synthase-like enzyme